MRAVRLLAALALAAALLPRPAAAQTRYIAFGDSITYGLGDNPQRSELGYPPRLEDLLQQRGRSAVVINAGQPGETTVEALSRINSVLNDGGDVLLLMEGTNDVGQRIPNETIRFDLQEMADRAEKRGMRVVHATLPPRLPTANFDGDNKVTEVLAGIIRDLAWLHNRALADPFEVFFHETSNVFADYYNGGEDKLHPNARGYDLLARIWADVLTDVDAVPPVTGFYDPRDGEENVPGTTPLRLDVYDFGTGIDLSATQLVINGTEVAAPLSGNERKIEIRYSPPQPLTGVVTWGLRTRDRTNPPNVVERTLARFVVSGTTLVKGDIDRNGRVDGTDLLALALHFGAHRGENRFSADADLNDDEVVNGDDLAILANNFGKSAT